MADQRQHPRIGARLSVRYGLNGTERSDPVENISESGVCIRTNDVYHVGSRIRVQIQLPQRTFHHAGEVMWAIRVPEHLQDSMACGMGIRFLDPDPGWSEHFRRWKLERFPVAR